MMHISVEELREKLLHEQVVLIDVREPAEHEDYNIGGQLIPLDDVLRRSAQIPKDEPVVVYCKRGIRSQIAIQKLEQCGFRNLINLRGGMEAWKRLTP